MIKATEKKMALNWKAELPGVLRALAQMEATEAERRHYIKLYFRARRAWYFCPAGVGHLWNKNGASYARPGTNTSVKVKGCPGHDRRGGK